MQCHLTGISRVLPEDQRSVKHEGQDPVTSFNIIDGDYIEQFLDLNIASQCLVIQEMLLNSNELNREYLREVNDLLWTLRNKH